MNQWPYNRRVDSFTGQPWPGGRVLQDTTIGNYAVGAQQGTNLGTLPSGNSLIRLDNGQHVVARNANHPNRWR
jgi:hypothetical protein